MRGGKSEEYDRLQAEQKKLGRFRPWMTHSRTENAHPIAFHLQLLADFNTVDEFGRKMLQELGRYFFLARRGTHVWSVVRMRTPDRANFLKPFGKMAKGS